MSLVKRNEVVLRESAKRRDLASVEGRRREGGGKVQVLLIHNYKVKQDETSYLGLGPC